MPALRTAVQVQLAVDREDRDGAAVLPLGPQFHSMHGKDGKSATGYATSPTEQTRGS
jgi:hypothetical protein